MRKTPPADHQAQLSNPERLRALSATGLMDSAAEASFDRFTRLAAQLLGTEVALLSLVDDNRQFIKSGLGLAEPWASRRETPLTHSFCQYAVSSAEPLIVVDAREHPYLRHNLAVAELAIVAYAGVPLVTAQAQVLGALCVVDSRPRPWSEQHVVALRDLAALTMTEIELRSQLAELEALQSERSKQRALVTSILDAMDDSVVVSGVDGKVLLTNPAARRHRPPEVLESTETLALRRLRG
jgi:GAF domain-containing protein